VDILGGSIQKIVAYDSSIVHISGGTIGLVQAGYDDDGHTSIVTILGTDFNYPYGAIPDDAGTLTGTLANGDPIDAPFEIHSDASIVLAVPEPNTVIMLCLVALTFLIVTAENSTTGWAVSRLRN